MAESYERLGLEIHLKTTDTFKQLQGLLDKLNSVQQALGAIGKSASTDGLGNTTRRIQALVEVTGKSAETIKRLNQQISDDNFFTKFAKGIQSSGASIKKDTEVLANSLNKLFSDEITKKGNEVIKTIKGQEKAEKESVASRVKAHKEYEASLDSMQKKQSQIDALYTSRQSSSTSASGKKILSPEEAWAAMDGRKATQVKASRKEQAEVARKTLSEIEKYERSAAAAAKESADAQIGAMRRITAERKVQQKLDTGFARSGVNLSGISGAVDNFALKFPKVDLTNIKSQITEINKLIASGGGQKELDGVRVRVAALGKEFSNLKERARQANQSTNLLTLSLQKMTQRMAEFYSVREVMFAVGRQVREAIAGVLDLSQAVHDIAAISGAAREDLDGISQSIMDIATHSRYTAKEVGELMMILAQAGVAAEILPQVAEQVGIFATATASQPDIAADVVTTAMNIYAIKAQDVTRITNAMTAALNESKLTTSGLATAFNYLAPQAAQLGMSMESTLGFIAQMAQAGIKPSTIGTGGSQMLKEFAAPKKRLKELMEHYKINPNDLNPRLRNIDEIINKLQEKHVAVEHLFQALETRVGRSVVTAVTQGGDAFKYMTESITGTNAATVAYEKAMEGARARVNVLKSEFLQLAVNIGNVVGPAFATFSSVLTTLLRGLNTEVGSFIVVLAGGTGLVMWLSKLTNGFVALRTALMALTSLSSLASALALFTTPVGLAVLGVGALAASLYALGVQAESSEASLEKLSERVNRSAEMERVFVEIRKGNAQSIRELEEAEKKGAEGTDAATRIKGQYVTMTDSAKIALDKFCLMHPGYLDKLNKEKLKVFELIDAYRELGKQRKWDDRVAIGGIRRVMEREKQYLATVPAEKPADSDSHMSKETWREARKKTLKRFQDEKTGWYSKVSDPRHIKFIGTRDGLPEYQDLPEPKEEKPVPSLFNNSNKTAQAAAKRTEALDRNINLELAESKIRMLKIEAETAKLDKEQAEIDLKRTGDLADYKTKAKIAIEKEYAAKESEEVLRILKEEAQALKGKVNVFYKTDGSIDWTNTNVTKGKGVTPGQEKAIRAQFSQEIANKRRATELEKGNALDNISIKFPAVQSSDNAEKHADKLLRITTSRIALAKEQAYTTREVLELEKEQVALEMTSYQIKKEAFEKEVKELEAQRAQAYQQEVGDAWDKQNLQNLDVKKEKLEEILQLIEQQRIKQQEADDTSPMGQLKRGTKDSWRTYAKEADDFKNLGAKLTTDGLDGMTNSLNNMVDAITSGGNAWRAFRNTLGEVMKGIADELQKHIMQMLVVYAVRKLIGFAMNSGDAASWGGSADVGAPGSWGGTFKDGGIIQPLLFARGGTVPSYLGTKGKDSVPAWLMPEEYVINADAVRYYGVDFFEKANKKRLASGGIVSSGSTSAGGPSMGDSEGKPVTLQIINLVDPNTIPKTTDEQIINVISLDAMKNGPSIRTIKAVLSGR